MVDSIHANGAPNPRPDGPLRPADADDVSGVAGPGEQASPQGSQARSDSIEFSDAARKLADHVREGAEDIPQSALPPERVAEIVQRLQQGFYDSADVREETVRRLLGDL